MAYITSVQNAAGWNGGTDTTIATPAWSLGAARLVVVFVRFTFNTDSTISSIVDTAGNTYTDVGIGRIGTIAGEAGYMQMFYAKNSTANASNIITVTFSVAVPYRNIIALEYSNMDLSSPVDRTAQGSANSNSVTTGSFTPTVADTVAVSAVSIFGTHGEVTPDANYVERINSYDVGASGTNAVLQAQDRIGAPVSAQTASQSWTGTFECDSIVANFKVRAGSAPMFRGS
jgi:hypothetical protein